MYLLTIALIALLVFVLVWLRVGKRASRRSAVRLPTANTIKENELAEIERQITHIEREARIRRLEAQIAERKREKN